MFNSLRASLPRLRKVRGYEIKRMPLGAYLRAAEAVKAMPGDLIRAVFPGQSLGNVLTQMKGVTSGDVREILGRAMLAVPRHMLTLLSELTEIPLERLENDPAIGLDGLAEILTDFLEVNRIENFIRAVGPLTAKMKDAFQQPKPGSSD